MLFKNLTVLLTFAVALVSGFGRSSKSCTCGFNYYSAADTQAAIDQAKTGNYGYSVYPHYFRGFGQGLGFLDMCELPWSEFPILPDESVYERGRPGPDRVVYDGYGNFCGCATHTGAPTRNGFVACT